jgi:hypothetical protein
MSTPESVAKGSQPVSLADKMWANLVEWARTRLLTSQLPLANPEDVAIPRCVNTADEAIAVVREYHVRWRAQGIQA